MGVGNGRGGWNVHEVGGWVEWVRGAGRELKWVVRSGGGGRMEMNEGGVDFGEWEMVVRGMCL